MFFSKPKDLRTEVKLTKKTELTDSIQQENHLKKANSSYWQLLLIPLLPILLLFKLLEYIHILTFVIFGALLIYFGITKYSTNSLTETMLLFSLGLILLVAPIMFLFDKDK